MGCTFQLFNGCTFLVLGSQTIPVKTCTRPVVVGEVVLRAMVAGSPMSSCKEVVFTISAADITASNVLIYYVSLFDDLCVSM